MGEETWAEGHSKEEAFRNWKGLHQRSSLLNRLLASLPNPTGMLQ